MQSLNLIASEETNGSHLASKQTGYTLILKRPFKVLHQRRLIGFDFALSEIPRSHLDLFLVENTIKRPEMFTDANELKPVLYSIQIFLKFACIPFHSNSAACFIYSSLELKPRLHF